VIITPIKIKRSCHKRCANGSKYRYSSVMSTTH